MQLYFLRHAQTDSNIEDRWMGLRDEPLNSEGIKQAKRAAIDLSVIEISAIYTSPLQRALQTAQYIVKKQAGECRITVLDGLRERDLAEFEGSKKTPLLLEALERSNLVESIPEMRKRLELAMSTIRQENGKILLVSHSGTYRVLTRYMKFSADPDVESLGNAECVKLSLP